MIYIRKPSLFILLLIFTTVSIVGCGERRCLSSGECLTSFSDPWYFIRYSITIILVILAVFLIIVFIASLFDPNEQGCSLFLGIIIILVPVLFIAHLSFPGNTLPSEQFRRKESKPSIQINRMEKAISELEQHRDKKLLPLKEELDDEYSEYYSDLRNLLQKLNIRDHEEFARKKKKYLEEADLLKRVATLEFSLKWIDTKLSNIEDTIRQLKQNLWNMELKKKLQSVSSSPEDNKTIEKLISTTNDILSKNQKPAEKQDTGKLEREIFNRVISE